MIVCPRCHRDLPAVPDCPGCGFAPEVVDGFRSWAPGLALDCRGFNPENFGELARLEAGNFWFRSRNALILSMIRAHASGFESFMEVGCGTGYVLSGVAAAFPRGRFHGSEAFTSALRFAAARLPRAEFVQMDARRIPYREEFSMVGAFDVLEHIEEDEAVLRGLRRSLKDDGILLLTVPQHRWLWSSVDVEAHHVRRYSAAEIHRKVRAAGFQILRSTSFMALLLPAMLLSRSRGTDGKTFDPMDEFNIHPALNRILGWILAFERAMIRAGLDLPLGGSRLVVARKTPVDAAKAAA